MMKVILVVLGILIASPVFAKGGHKGSSKRCKHIEVSCQGIDGAKRDYFCAKKQPSEKRKAKVCKKAEKKKKHKTRKKMKNKKATPPKPKKVEKKPPVDKTDKELEDLGDDMGDEMMNEADPAE